MQYANVLKLFRTKLMESKYSQDAEKRQNKVISLNIESQKTETQYMVWYALSGKK